MKKIKKHLVFRYVILTLFLSVMIFQSQNFSSEQVSNYKANAEKLLDGEYEHLSQLNRMKYQRSVEKVYKIGVGIFFMLIALNYVNRVNRWWLIFPIILLLSLFFGTLEAYLIRFLNENYAISFTKGSSTNYGITTFRDLRIWSIYDMIYVFFSMCLFYDLEKIVFQTKSSVKSVQFTYWLGLYLIFAALTYLFLSVVMGFGFNIMNDEILFVMVFALMLTLVSMFFINAFVVNDQFTFKRSTNKFFHVLVSSLGLLGILILTSSQPGLDLFVESFFFPIQIFSGLLVIIICAITYLLYLANLGNARSTFKLKADLQKQGSELNFLKSQVNPHFLFNSLNTLYGIALQEESLRTADGIQKLSEMMRFMLRENTADKIPVSREINYINNYIDLQSLRVSGGNDIALNIDIAEACPNQIAPMLLIPFIENAFKHGISMQHASWIKVQLTCDLQSVRLEVKNTKHNQPTKKFEESGIGIENVKKRLEILYPDAYELTIDEQDETYKTILKIWLI